MSHRIIASIVSAGLVTGLALASPPPVGAQPLAPGAPVSWRSVDPPGTRVTDLAVSPDTPQIVYASTRVKALRSDDGGSGWRVLPGNLGGDAVAVHPDTPDIVLLGGSSGDLQRRGIFRSTDGGSTWKRTSFSATDLLRIAPTDPTVVYAVGLEGPLRSFDGGQSWEGLGGALDPITLALDPSDPATIYAGTTTRLFRSTDFGDTFEERDEGLRGSFLTTIAVGPSDPEVLYAGTRDGIFRSLDAGASWVSANGVEDVGDDGGVRVTGEVVALAVDPRDAGTVLAATSSAVFRTTDGGDTWEDLLDSRFRGLQDLVVDPLEPQRLIAGTVLGTFLSVDAGESWSFTLDEISDHPARFLATTAADPGLVLIADRFGAVLRTADGGRTWQGVAGAAERLAIAPSDPRRVYLQRNVDRRAPLLRSDDGGLGFEPVPFPQRTRTRQVQTLVALSFSDLEVHPTDPDVVYVSNSRLRSSEGGFFRESSNHLWRSRDGGETWEDAFPGGPRPVLSLAVSRAAPSRLYAVTENRLFVSHDGGDRFEPGIPVPEVSPIATVVADPFDADRIWLAGEGGVARSDDGGRHFVPSDTGLPPGPLLSLLPDPAVRGSLHAVVESHGPYISSDLGATWRSVRGGVPPSRFTGPLAAGIGGTGLWAGTEGGVLALQGRPSCEPDDTTLCLQGDRFQVRVRWRDFQGGRGSGQKMLLTEDTGTFWFFDPDNLELMVKVLDARTVNGHFWVFYGSLSNVAFTLQVLDTATGRLWVRENPAGRFASAGDALAFPAGSPP